MIDLCTADDVKLKLETVTNDFDTNIGSLITDVSHRAQTWIDRDLELQTYIEIYDGGGRRLYPRNPPVITVTEIRISLSLDFAGGSIVPTTDYALVNQNWDIAHVACWPAGQNGVQAEYISGYLDAANTASLIPKDLRGAIARQVAYEFKYRKFDGMTQADVADGVLALQDTTWLTSVKPLLRKYMKAKLG
jgi:hypothetical protein